MISVISLIIGAFLIPSVLFLYLLSCVEMLRRGIPSWLVLIYAITALFLIMGMIYYMTDIGLIETVSTNTTTGVIT